jgi:hypothetical protein
MDDARSTDAGDRTRRRASAAVALAFSPFVLALAALKVAEPHRYAAGDVRNDPTFWVVLGLVTLVVVAVVAVRSIAVLRER